MSRTETGDTLRGQALALAAQGWSIVPLHAPRGNGCTCGNRDCPSPGKHPRVPWARWQRERPPADTVRWWWRRWPSANLGVVTGAVSGVIVVDVDPRHGGHTSLAELEAGFGPLPLTLESRTGGGGRHIYLQHPGGTVTSRPIAAGVELKGDGGLVVAPPSTHPSGAVYEWVPGYGPGDVEAAVAPWWLLDLGACAHPLWRPTPPVLPRTAAERAEFARLWAALGIDLGPGDQMYRCPLHDDHRPSLHIDADGCRWFCFGCGRGGGSGRLRRILHRPAPSGEAPPPAPPTLAGGTTVAVVGEASHQDALLALTGGRRHYGGADHQAIARLVPDRGNPSDPQAIAVFIGPHLVGYLTRADARRLRPTVEEAIERAGRATCVATIRGGWERPAEVGRFGVVLWLPGTSEAGGAA